MSTFFQADPEHFVLMWRLLTGFGFCLAVIIFAVMKFPQVRRQQFQDSMGCGWVSSCVVAISICAGFSYFAWQKSGDSFVKVALEQENLVLFYILPERETLIDLAEIDYITLQYMGKQDYRLVIRTLSGHGFYSVAHPRHRIKDMYAEFKQRLKHHDIHFRK